MAGNKGHDSFNYNLGKMDGRSGSTNIFLFNDRDYQEGKVAGNQEMIRKQQEDLVREVTKQGEIIAEMAARQIDHEERAEATQILKSTEGLVSSLGEFKKLAALKKLPTDRLRQFVNQLSPMAERLKWAHDRLDGNYFTSAVGRILNPALSCMTGELAARDKATAEETIVQRVRDAGGSAQVAAALNDKGFPALLKTAAACAVEYCEAVQDFLKDSDEDARKNVRDVVNRLKKTVERLSPEEWFAADAGFATGMRELATEMAKSAPALDALQSYWAWRKVAWIAVIVGSLAWWFTIGDFAFWLLAILGFGIWRGLAFLPASSHLAAVHRSLDAVASRGRTVYDVANRLGPKPLPAKLGEHSTRKDSLIMYHVVRVIFFVAQFGS